VPSRFRSMGPPWAHSALLHTWILLLHRSSNRVTNRPARRVKLSAASNGQRLVRETKIRPPATAPLHILRIQGRQQFRQRPTSVKVTRGAERPTRGQAGQKAQPNSPPLMTAIPSLDGSPSSSCGSRAHAFVSPNSVVAGVAQESPCNAAQQEAAPR